ncbi:MAG: DNA repair protein RecN [Anaerovoracaceae bacterium]|nr:DNA repair protein RecN [Anaerovoracaceae bacterium]
MITHIRIKDFAIIKEVEMDFQEGLTVITGETGSGKSIMVEAISLALGSRADSTYVRAGTEKAIVQMIADLHGEEVIITREVNANGKNICRINNTIVPLNELANLSKKIADIHGQYDHQSLLNVENHILLVDSYKAEEILPKKESVGLLYSQYTGLKNKLKKLKDNTEELERSRDFMEYQLNEIQLAALFLGEDDELNSRRVILQNSEKIFQKLDEAYMYSNGEAPSSLDNIYKSLAALKEVSGFSPEIQRLEEEYKDAYYRLEDASKELLNIKEAINFSQDELNEILSRLDIIDNLKRKYGGTIAEILSFADSLSSQLSAFENFEDMEERLQKEFDEVSARLAEECQALSSLRKLSAKKLQEGVQEELKELGFTNSTFLISILDLPHFTNTGGDKVEFLISTNKGEPLKALSKIASGGEMSRIMLAFKKIIADYDDVSAMIFDEIDSGISGIAASVVGKKLKQIAKNHQIICITHLPQIAACGKNNFRIEKQESHTHTFTNVVPLNQDEKVREIARLIGGETITSTTIESAKELISASSQ